MHLRKKRTCLAGKSISTAQSGNNQDGRVTSEFTAGASKLAWAAGAGGGGAVRVKGGLQGRPRVS